jgi:DNA helicase-2/ATP-dependent DNA helicase PcrA
MELQLELTRRNIPYRVQSGVRFFEQAHIKDVISYLRIIVNPRDELAWKRILKMIPGVGNATANRIFETIALSARSGTEQATGQPADNDLALSLRSVEPRIRNKPSWQDFVKLLEMLVQQENRNNPSKQIELVLTNGYEQYLRETYENAEARIEDLKVSPYMPSAIRAPKIFYLNWLCFRPRGSKSRSRWLAKM